MCSWTSLSLKWWPHYSIFLRKVDVKALHSLDITSAIACNMKPRISPTGITAGRPVVHTISTAQSIFPSIENSSCNFIPMSHVLSNAMLKKQTHTELSTSTTLPLLLFKALDTNNASSSALQSSQMHSHSLWIHNLTYKPDTFKAKSSCWTLSFSSNSTKTCDWIPFTGLT